MSPSCSRPRPGSWLGSAVCVNAGDLISNNNSKSSKCLFHLDRCVHSNVPSAVILWMLCPFTVQFPHGRGCWCGKSSVGINHTSCTCSGITLGTKPITQYSPSPALHFWPGPPIASALVKRALSPVFFLFSPLVLLGLGCGAPVIHKAGHEYEKRSPLEGGLLPTTDKPLPWRGNPP